MNDFVGGKKASEMLNVHQRTLYLWDKKGAIETMRTPGNKRLYNVKKYLDNVEKYLNDTELPKYELDEKDIEVDDNISDSEERLNICYVRVPSHGQKDDLERQKQEMIKNFPEYKIIEDIGSGLNLNKCGIKRIIKLGIEGKIENLAVAYKDRLTRFGFELIEDIIKTYSNGTITILHKKKNVEPEEELIKDMMSIMNVYVAKMNGLRKYKT